MPKAIKAINAASARYSLTLVVAVVSALSMLSGCAALHPESPRSDAAITEAIQARFAADRTVDARAVKVETRGGVVLLSGQARDWTEKTVAEQVALKVNEVRTIRNDIVIGDRG